MRILLIVPDLRLGGAERIIVSLARGLADRGHSVNILVFYREIEFQIPVEVALHCLTEPTRRMRFGWPDKRILAWSLKRWFRIAGPFDLVVSNLPFASEVVDLAGVENVWHHIHGTLSAEVDGLLPDRKRKAHRRLKRYRRIFDGKNLIAVSDGVASDLREGIGLSRSNIVTIYNPHDFDEIRQMAAMPDSAIPALPYVAHVGRFTKGKRHDLLLDAYAASGIAHNLVLMTRSSRELLHLIESRGLSSRVSVVGFQGNPFPWYAAASALILCSDHEGLPNVLIEALASGTPVISTDCPSGPREILQGSFERFLSPVGDVEALAQNLRKVIDVPPTIDAGIPQSLAYALLAGLPPEIGLYASIAPLLIYTVFGTSMTLAVGPVAVASLMTASAIGELVARGTPEYLGAAIVLALISGLLMIVMGVARLGFLANFLSHPVISGFITASAMIIAFGQMKHILGFSIEGHNIIDQAISLVRGLSDTNIATVVIGVAAAAFLVWTRRALAPLLERLGLSKKRANSLSKASPVIAVVATTLAVWIFELQSLGVAVVGNIPSGLPRPALPEFDVELWRSLFLPALLIAVVGYVETISVAQTLAARRRERIDPDQELIALGTANVGSAVSGGFPVTGGFARSVVNFDAGARTPGAGALTAIGIALATVFLTPLLYFLPKATLAATIIVAVLSLIDMDTIRHTWSYSKADFTALLGTILGTLAIGVEIGIAIGVLSSLALFRGRTARPHYAIVGRVPGTEHYRNVNRHKVETAPGVLSIRVDESLYFPNARFLEDTINDAVSLDTEIRDVVLMCPAVNFIDASALESLEQINHRLVDAGIKLHLSEVKGPVMDRLKRTDFLEHLSGKVFLSQFDADRALRSGLEIAAK